MKYINADRLREKIIDRLDLFKELSSDTISPIRIDECKQIIDIIDSLQQEPQEVDLEKEIEKYYYDNFAFISSAHTPTKDIVSDIATHFYERGQRKAAEMYDEIEYNRQRAEEEMLGKTLDEAVTTQMEEDGDVDYFVRKGIDDIALKYAKLGAKWMAEQGVSWEDKMTYYDGFLLYGKDERAFTMEGNFNEGDKVIVQIRKKEESK